MHHFILAILYIQSLEILKLVIWIGDVLILSNERSNGESVTQTKRLDNIVQYSIHSMQKVDLR